MPGTAWDLVAAHERHRALDPETRKREGAYYTPEPIARHLAGRALFPLIGRLSRDQLAGLRILDPAAGGGAFLLAACDVLIGAGLTPAAAAACCNGYDRDPTALAVAREALAAHTGAMPGLLRRTDSLLRPPEPDWDVILGNPPWEKIARTDPRKSALDKAFSEIREGEINLHALFLAWALRSLKPGGRLAFLTPNTWLLNRFDARLRRFVLAHRVESIEIFPQGTFPATPVTIPAAILVENALPSGPTYVRGHAFSSQCRQQIWLRRPHAGMSVHDDFRLASVEQRWAGRSAPLGDLARASDGIYTSTARKHAFQKVLIAPRLPIREPQATDRPILLSGAELGRDLVLPAGAYVPEELWRRHPAQDRDRLALHAARHPSLPRRLVGAVVPAGLYLSNRFIAVTSDSHDAFFLAAVLLARVIDGYFARRFPVADVDAFMLDQLPIPKAGATARRRLADAARRRAALARAALLAIAIGSREHRILLEAHRKIDVAIEAEIGELLGLSAAEAAWLALPPGDTGAPGYNGGV